MIFDTDQTENFHPFYTLKLLTGLPYKCQMYTLNRLVLEGWSSTGKWPKWQRVAMQLKESKSALYRNSEEYNSKIKVPRGSNSFLENYNIGEVGQVGNRTRGFSKDYNLFSSNSGVSVFISQGRCWYHRLQTRETCPVRTWWISWSMIPGRVTTVGLV